MDIIFQAHHAVISDHMREKAERAVRRVAERLPRATGAVVRFEEDGPTRRVEIVLHANGRRLVAESSGRFFGPAVTTAAQRLVAQAGRGRRLKNKKYVRRAAAAALSA